MRPTILAVFLNLILAQQLLAADISNNGVIITLSGPINTGDAVRFREVALRGSPKAVVLYSPGGKLNDGLEIAQTVRDLGLTTTVPAQSDCYSVCALIWVAGLQRDMSRSARIGFHAAYYHENGAAKESGVGNARVGAFLTRIGLPETAVVYMTIAPPDDFAPLTPEVARRIGVKFSYWDPEFEGKDNKAPEPVNNTSNNSGIDHGKAIQLGFYGDWAVYTAGYGKGKTCYALGQPRDRQSKSKLKETPAYIFITTRPGENIRNEVAIKLGYATRERSSGAAEIDGEVARLITKGQNAWVEEKVKEREFVGALRRGSTLVVKTSSITGKSVVDTYSLKGLSDALERIAEECG